MVRLLLWAAFAAIVPFVTAASAAGAAERIQVLHGTGTPQLVVGPPQTERMTVLVRGVSRGAGLAYPAGGSFLGHAVAALPLPRDLRPDEPIVVRIEPADIGPAHLIAADDTLYHAVAAARFSGLVLGILLVVVLVQIGAFLATREPSIPWYVALIGGLAAIVLARDAVLPVAPGASAVLVLDVFCAVAATGFVTVYLRLWTQARPLFWTLVGACGASVAIGLAGAALPELRPHSETLRVPLFFLFGAVLLGVTLVRARSYPAGWILFGGTSLLVASTAYRALRAHIGTPFLDHWAFELGATLDALIFASAILVRVRYAFFERRSMERRLREATYEANHDSLTGALNRRGLFSRAQALRGTLFSIDLDGFKQVNDRFGHAAGDLVLVDVVRELRRAVDELDIVARIGGDEFVVITAQADPREVAELARHFTTVIEAIALSGTDRLPAGVGASVGYAQLDGVPFDRALRLADAQAYDAKAAHRLATG
jgi:diguanylate cyclase (GGDEF)-like protein